MELVKQQDILHTRVSAKLKRELGGEVLEALANPRTIEVMVNADGAVWHEMLGVPMKQIGSIKSSYVQAVIETVASFHRIEATAKSPIVEAELPLDGSRFAGQLPPVVSRPCFAIRKKAIRIFSLDDYVGQGILSSHHASIIVEAIKAHKSIIVAGGTGSGKTTLTNAIIARGVDESPAERIVIIEDTGEIQCSAINHVQYRTSETVSMADLLKATLRMRPDRILVGEVRDHEALDLLDAWNTGHPGGVATIHANSSLSALSRLTSLVSRNSHAPRFIEPLVAEAVDLVVFIQKEAGARRVTELLEVTGYQNNDFLTRAL